MNAHHPSHWTRAASGGLGPDPAVRSRGAVPHLSCSKAASGGHTTGLLSAPSWRTVIQALPAKRTDDPFRVRVLPRRPRRRHDLLDAEDLGRTLEALPIDLVPVPHQEPRRRLLRKRLDKLPRSPLRGGVRRGVEVHHPSTVMRQNDEPERTPKVAVGTTKKSSATRSLRWFSRNARQVGDGGFRRRGMYFATVEMATSMPSFASSLRMRGAPQVTFACDILRIRLTTSRSSPGRPKRPGLLFRLQKRLKPSRCHRITVAGSAIARAFLQSAHPCERITQKVRSHTPRRRRRLPRVRMSTASCCRSARFSSASSRRVRNSDVIVPRRAHRRLHTRPTVPAERVAAQGVSAGRRFRQAHRAEAAGRGRD